MKAASDRFVSLPGLIVPTEALQLALDLEARGFRLKVDDGDLLVAPFGRLTAAECEQITRWKRHLCALVAFSEDVMKARPA